LWASDAAVALQRALQQQRSGQRVLLPPTPGLKLQQQLWLRLLPLAFGQDCGDVTYCCSYLNCLRLHVNCLAAVAWLLRLVRRCGCGCCYGYVPCPRAFGPAASQPLAAAPGAGACFGLAPLLWLRQLQLVLLAHTLALGLRLQLWLLHAA
jgi:hypothetical protein